MRFGATMYVKNSLEAAAFYQEAFGLSLGIFEKHGDGTYIHAPLLKDGAEIFCVSEETGHGALVDMMLTSTQHPVRCTALLSTGKKK